MVIFFLVLSLLLVKTEIEKNRAEIEHKTAQNLLDAVN